jgi:hypothetical protein
MLYIADLGTYSHVMPGLQEEAALKIDAGLRLAMGQLAVVG